MTKNSEQELRRKYNQFVCKVVGKLCERLLKGVLTFLGYLGYATTIRAFIISYYGFYWVGLIDGTIIATTLVTIIVYAYSRFSEANML